MIVLVVLTVVYMIPFGRLCSIIEMIMLVVIHHIIQNLDIGSKILLDVIVRETGIK